jgi:hypothetical protein
VFVHVGSCLLPVNHCFLHVGQDLLDFADLNLHTFVFLLPRIYSDQIDDVLKVDLLNRKVGLEVPSEFSAELNLLENQVHTSIGQSSLLVDLLI